MSFVLPEESKDGRLNVESKSYLMLTTDLERLMESPCCYLRSFYEVLSKAANTQVYY